jgi:aspartate/methionine/tyrosine aminotransferase
VNGQTFFVMGGLTGLGVCALGRLPRGAAVEILREVIERLELICDTYLSVSTPVQLAAAELLERGAAVRVQIATRVASNYGRLRALAAAAPSSRVLTASAGWYAVVQVPTLRSEEELVLDLVTSDGVLAHPGYFFDFPRESYLIVSLVIAGGVLAAGVERMLERAER